ncbi:MAG: 23S rRNA (guanosine(2251)-2'-O)-methyltransferase RlmB [Alphaproteobacteria bacterium]|nr:23S rRNA (guanosine(2251)-2'-O)-methyltransferase RlmB [Alphaproteobacteria bacterium]
MPRRPDPSSRRPDGPRRPQAPRRPPVPGLWLFGTHAVLAALANPERRHHRLLATADALRGLEADLRRLRTEHPIPEPESVAREDIDRQLPPGAVHQGVALLVDPLAPATLEDVARRAEGREAGAILVLDQVTDPHNVGAILRSAAAFGALAVVVQDRHSPEETGTLAKAASGALERMPLVREPNLARAIEDLKRMGFWVAGLAADAPVTLAEAKLSGRVALVLGSEGEGLRRLTRDSCDLLVRLPQTTAVESLNVSNAAAVALYELAR